VLGQLGDVGDTVGAQRSPEGATLHCQREAGRIGVQVRSPSRQPAGRIGSEARLPLVADRDDPQQIFGWRTLPTTHAGAFRPRTSYHR